MSTVLLINIDQMAASRQKPYANLALAKIRRFHLDKGDEVICNFPLYATMAEKIYVSCVFDWNRHLCEEWEQYANADIGGSGYSLTKNLPLEINSVKPRINLGFTTRGCIRNCSFCIVPQKEGSIRVVGDISDLWDGVSNGITLMDNNILAAPQHFMTVCEQLKDRKLKVDFNQGLDHRLLTPTICEALLSLTYSHRMTFAFDHIGMRPSVQRSLSMLQDAGMDDWSSRWYVYAGPNDTFATVYDRLCFIQDHKQVAYLMRDRAVAHRRDFMGLAQWVNSGPACRVALPELLATSQRMKQYARDIPIAAAEEVKEGEGLNMRGEVEEVTVTVERHSDGTLATEATAKPIA